MTYTLKFRLKELADEHHISLRELARLSNIEPSIINKMANNKRNSIYIEHLEHLERIANALNLEDLSDIVYLQKEK